MAIKIRTKRLATSKTNPRTVKPRAATKTRKRKLSPKQIKHFGTKRQKAALKASRTRKAAPKKAAKSKSNPAWIVTLGQGLASINPNKRSTTKMAKTKKRKKPATSKKRRVVRASSNPKPRKRKRAVNKAPKRRRRASNPKIVVRYRTRKNSSKRTTRRTARNPEIFGSKLGSKDSIKMIGGGIVGVAATKFLPTLLPTSTLASVASSNLGKTAISLAAALGAGYLASKLDARFGQGVYFGGVMQASSVALNAFLPSLYKTLNIGMGDFVPAQFAVPQNPVRAGISAPSHAMAPSGSRVTMSGLARAYAPAY